MSTRAQLLERRGKLAALATRGIGGERENAIAALARFDAKHPELMATDQNRFVDPFSLNDAVSLAFDMAAFAAPFFYRKPKPQPKRRTKGRATRKRSR